MSSRLIVIIGAGPRMGAAVARRFAADGYDIGLIARNAGNLEKLTATLTAEGATVGWATADMADAAALDAAVRRMIERTGRIDVLLHNASVFRPGTATATSPEEFLADLTVGAVSLLTAVRAALPTLREQRTGTVLATGSMAADHPDPEAATLGVQKAALRNLVQVLAADLRGTGVHAATLTVRGTIGEGGLTPERIADALAELTAETAADPETWRTVVDLSARAADPTPRL